MAVGTPSYLSPEQIRRENLDARTDLFSFGLVLYEMATGERAFGGNTATEIRDAVLSQVALGARQLNPVIPLALEKVINKSLEKEPRNRYQTAREFRTDLVALSTEGEIIARRVPRGIWGAAAAVLVIIGTFFLLNMEKIRGRLLYREGASESAATFRARRSVAVLGFKNLSGKEDKEWISGALSEMLSVVSICALMT